MQTGTCHNVIEVGSQLLQGWIWLVLANVRWRWWQPIRDHCFSGRVSLTATNITRPTLDFIEEIYHFWFTVSVFVHRARIEEEIVVWEKEEEIVVWEKEEEIVRLHWRREEGFSCFSQTQRRKKKAYLKNTHVVGMLIFYAVVFYLFATSLLWDLTFLLSFG